MERKSWDWRSSPIVIVPIAAFAFGLAIVPLAVTNADHAAQFYGSFLAAIVAAGAVIGNSILQERLQARRDEARLAKQSIVEVLMALSHVRTWKTQIKSAKEFLESIQFETLSETEGKGDLAEFNMGEIRLIFPSMESFSHQAILNIGAKYGWGVGKILHEVNVCITKGVLFSRDIIPDNVRPPRAFINAQIGILKSMAKDTDEAEHALHEKFEIGVRLMSGDDPETR